MCVCVCVRTAFDLPGRLVCYTFGEDQKSKKKKNGAALLEGETASNMVQ